MTQKFTINFETLTNKIEVFHWSSADVAFMSNAEPNIWTKTKAGWYWWRNDITPVRSRELFGPFALQEEAMENGLTVVFGPSP